MYYLRLFMIAFPLIILTGCQEDKEDLVKYIESVKVKEQLDIEPVPVIAIHQNYAYTGGRDPFVPTDIEVIEDQMYNEVAMNDNGLRPDASRRKEALEYYDLDQLKLVGMLEKEATWALIKAPDGVIHRIKTGNYLGKNHGKIIAVSEDRVTLTEIVQDGRGSYMERGAFLSAELEGGI